MTDIIETIERAHGKLEYIYLYLGCLAIGFIIAKGNRKVFFLPAILITIATLNPFVKKIIEEADGGNVYWRALWMIPIVAVCAAIPAIIVDKVRHIGLHAIIITVSLAVFIGIGSFVYNNDATAFSEAPNPDKLPDKVISIADELLSLEEEPRIVADGSLSTYLRQYSGKIRAPYSRSVTYGTPSALGEKIFGYLITNQYAELSKAMINNDYRYLITDNSSGDKQNALKEAGFEQILQNDQYGVYIAHGIPNEKREYNEKGQVTRLTYVDEKGNLRNNDYGYAEVRNEYENGLLSLAIYLDAEGNEIDYGSGFFHRYLKWLQNVLHEKDIAVFISIKDEGTYSLSNLLQKDLKDLGIKTRLLGQTRKSYYAIIYKDTIIEKLSNSLLRFSGDLRGHKYTIVSGGYTTGNTSSIQIDGEEYSKNRRGMNFVVYDLQQKQVVESISFDTYSPEMSITR